MRSSSRSLLQRIRYRSEDKKAEILDDILIVLMFIVILVSILTSILAPILPSDFGFLFILEIAAAIAILILLALNRYVSETYAKYGFLIVLVLFGIFSDDPIQVFDGRGVIVFVLPIIAASLFLRPKTSFLAALLTSIIHLAFAVYLGMIPNFITIALYFTIAFLMWLLTSNLERTTGRLQSTSKALRKIDDRYRTMLESFSEGIIVIRDEQIVYANSLAAKILTQKRDDLIGVSILNYVEEDFQSKFKKDMKSITTKQIPSDTLTTRLVPLKGKSIQVELSSIPIYFEGTQAIQIVIRDLSVINTMEDSLRRLFGQQIELNRFATILGETYEPEKVYRTTYEFVQKLLDTKSFIISLFDQDEKMFEAAFIISEGNEIDTSVLPRIPLEEEGKGTQSRVIWSSRFFYTPNLAKTLAETKTSYTFNEEGEVFDGDPPVEEESSTRSALYVPMKVAGNIAGVMQVQSHLPDAYSQDDIDLFSSIANISSLAIHKALLFNELKEMNVELTNRIEEREILLREIHHRVKNNLQVISSLLYLESKDIDDDKTKAVLIESQTRIKSMSLIHELLYKSENRLTVSLRTYITELMALLISSYKINRKKIKTIIKVDDVDLPIDKAVPCGIILNEIITNSLKYAFPDDKSGELRITVEEQETAIRLTIDDNGVGFIDSGETRNLGMKLVENLVQNQLKGTITLDSSKGTKYEIVIPSERS